MSEKLIIGSKDGFALEISSEDASYKMGIFLIWINGICLGEREVTFIKPNLLALASIRDLSEYPALNIFSNSVDVIFSTILHSDELYTKTLLGFGESFDRYLLRLYIFELNVVFLWTFFPSQDMGDIETQTLVSKGVISSSDFWSVLADCERIMHFTLPINKK